MFLTSKTAACWFLAATTLMGGVGGRISGVVTDPRGAVVAGALVCATQSGTSFKRLTTTDAAGLYAIQDLTVGAYNIDVAVPGFKPSRRTGVAIDSGSSVSLDVSLAVGDRAEAITISAAGMRVETSDTQLGEVIGGLQIAAVPLNGRSFTDLLALQPGVAPVTTIGPGTITAAGASTISPSGNVNPGTISINGQREYSNGFTVNGADVEERFTMGAAIIPNLESIAEFRILTSNFDAEYGNYSGGQVNVVTRSGSNQFHGNGFEFLRNTSLDARNFFSPARAVYQQNQFGGTLGGPIWRNKVFFFTDYQGTRLKQGVDTGLERVPSASNRNGNFTDLASQLTGQVNGQHFADQLSARLGYTVSPAEPYYSPNCTSTLDCVFPNAVIPQRAWSAPARQLLPYIPAPNQAGVYFTTSATDQLLRDDKGAFRIDGDSRFGRLSAYYFVDDYSLDNPYPTQQGGASVPGFNALNMGRAQLATFSDTKALGGGAVNELRLAYVRSVNRLGVPSGGVGPTLAAQGFINAQGNPSILPQRPGIQGIENVIFNNFVIGVDITGLNQTDNTFEVQDNFSRVFGRHTVKFGGELLDNQVNALPDVQSNGTFSFFGSETGVDFADFLLGAPSRYTQGDAQAFYMRNRYGAAYVQDSWRASSRLTLNYGLRWDASMPWYEKYNQIQTIVPGEQSVVFPGAPQGLVFPGDPGIARSLAPIRWNNFSPRLGLAYAPGGRGGWLSHVFGERDESSIRLGFGRYFSAVEGIAAGVMAGDAPYGSTYTSPAPPLFNDPFVNAADGYNNGQRFPLKYPPLNASASHPNSSVDWSQFLPITGLPGYYPGNRSPYTEQFNVTLQRQFGRSTLVTASYVGSQSHHQIVLLQANPGIPALCLSVSQPSQVAPGTQTCGPFGESSRYVTAAGQSIDGTRSPFGSKFGSVDWLSTIGNANFNAFEFTLRRTTRHGEVLAGYTYSKSIDQSSSLSDQLNPLNYRLTRAPSAFDLKHNVVASYRYELPFERYFSRNRLAAGWTLSGISRFSSGFPVTLYNNSDNSLLGTQPDGVNPYGVDLPNVQPGTLSLNHDPRNGRPYFNTARFSLQPLGQPGNAARRFFYGPGLANFDLAVTKNVSLTESKSLLIRAEAFNVFNHTQFFGPASVSGNITSSSFGQVVGAGSPRLVQVAAKLTF